MVLAALLLPGPGCVRNPAGSRCEVVCRAEAVCAERLGADVSYSQCVQACAELEREAATQKLVEEHIQCVLGAPTCTQAMECP